MKQFTLTHLEPNNDANFLNTTSIHFDFKDGENDSGWRDMFTGARILSSSDTIIFHADKQDELALKLKFGYRLVELQANW